MALDFLLKVAAGERTSAGALWAGDAEQSAVLEWHFDLMQANRLWRARLIDRFPDARQQIERLGDDRTWVEGAAKVMEARVTLKDGEAWVMGGAYGVVVLAQRGGEWKVVRMCVADEPLRQQIAMELRHRTTTLHAMAAEIADGFYATPQAAVSETTRRLMAGERRGA